jgi:hypothetical protein
MLKGYNETRNPMTLRPRGYSERPVPPPPPPPQPAAVSQPPSSVQPSAPPRNARDDDMLRRPYFLQLAHERLMHGRAPHKSQV